MNDLDDDFDTDDDFGDAEEDTVEALVWQLLLLINPGDEETAQAQFEDYREAVAGSDDETKADNGEPVEVVGRIIDWRSGFYVGTDDTRSLVQAVDELSARWNLSIDWGGDAGDDEFHVDMDVPSLLSTAYDRLAEFGYTLWSWETDDGCYAGWITMTRDAEPMRELATALDINLRLASEVS
ncbi:MAG: hypothetical protein ABI114_15575 [Rhodanobacter sp.]